MPVDDERNVLHVGPRAGNTEITPAMAETVRRRIAETGGKLVVWAVLNEDTYETSFGDGFYIHVAGIALNSEDAHALVALAGETPYVRWHVRRYELGLVNGLPAFLQPWSKQEEFTIAHFVEILADMPAGKAASKLCTGTSFYKDGPFVELPSK
jgi:hypothetical protein